MSFLINAKVEYLEGSEPQCYSREVLSHRIRKHRNRIKDYEAIAKRRVPSFLDTYVKDIKGQVIPGLPLSHYQAWVIEEISKKFNSCKNASVVEQYVKNNQHKFSYQEFLKCRAISQKMQRPKN